MYDIAIAGGGINGCGIARDAAGRGYSVLLAEMDDLAAGTSSRSTKLVHGGLRYLEHYEFRLVREALMEREVLWNLAPHIIWPMRFVLPHHKGMRPAWMLRMGLFLYDHIGGKRSLPSTYTLDMTSHVAGKPLKPGFTKAFEYSDLWVNDSRLVVLNARDAANRGTDIRTRTKIIEARREDGIWTLTLEDRLTGETKTEHARILINATGPWVDGFLSSSVRENDVHNVRLVKGSHIVVPKLFEHDRCYLFQNADERIIFAIPYEGDYTLIGTTDEDYEGDPAAVAISEAETEYLCHSASEYFQNPVLKEEVVSAYSGVRPLFDDGASKAQEATRDYVLKLDGAADEAGLINIFGGKITTYRRLAEEVVEMAEERLEPKGKPWTADQPLPGGDVRPVDLPALGAKLANRLNWLSEVEISRLIATHGTQCDMVFEGVDSCENAGEDFGHGLFACEVQYFRNNEWAATAEDILWRRTKLGLRMSASQVQHLEDWISRNPIA